MWRSFRQFFSKNILFNGNSGTVYECGNPQDCENKRRKKNFKVKKFHGPLFFFVGKYESWTIISNDVSTDIKLKDFPTSEKKIYLNPVFPKLERKCVKQFSAIYLKNMLFNENSGTVYELRNLKDYVHKL